MAFGEAVSGKAFYLMPYVFDKGIIVPLFAAVFKILIAYALELLPRPVLATHAAAQHIGFTQGKTCEVVGYLDDIFLVYHNTIGIGHDLSQYRVHLFPFLRETVAYNVFAHHTRTRNSRADDGTGGYQREVILHLQLFQQHAHSRRLDIKTANGITTIEDYYKENKNLRFSRIPIYQTNADNIIGLVLKTDVLDAMINNNGTALLESIKRPIVLTKRNQPIAQLFEELVQSKNHMAAVLDEYGSFSGLITQEDVIETLLGLEIMDESDSVEDLQQLAKKNLAKRIEKLKNKSKIQNHSINTHIRTYAKKGLPKKQ